MGQLIGIKIVKLLLSRTAFKSISGISIEKLLLTMCNVHTRSVQYFFDLFILYQTILQRTIDNDCAPIAQTVQLVELYLLYSTLWCMEFYIGICNMRICNIPLRKRTFCYFLIYFCPTLKFFKTIVLPPHPPLYLTIFKDPTIPITKKSFFNQIKYELIISYRKMFIYDENCQICLAIMRYLEAPEDVMHYD